MQRTQNKKNEVLKCTYGKCEKPQGMDGEFCEAHSRKIKNTVPVFNQTEFNLLFEALDCLAQETQALWESRVETKKYTTIKQKMIKRLETKLETL